MRTFTVRDLDREPSRVLDACDKEGSVQIRRRDGRSYTMRPEAPSRANGAVSFAEWFAERRRHTRKLCGDLPPMTKKQLREFDRLIASE